MESGNGGASSKGVCVPVSNTSEVFHNSILAPLQSACLYEESKQSFRYKSAVLIKNPALEEKYNAFRAKRRERGYSEEDLKETYGFLLFDDVNKAHALGETGVLTGNSTCTTLGDPWKGVYISMYSDCLDLNRWYHGKTGYVAIIRLTQGRVKKVLENYTQNFTAPTVGFDCHVSEDLPMVSAKTSSFLAFERTQYYIYELLDDGSNETAQSPSAACPFAIVSFSYTDTKGTLEAQEESSKEKKRVFHYLPWRGQLQVASHTHNVGLRSKAGALIPAKLPPVVKVDKAISMTEVIQMLPKPVFETCFSGEVFLDGLYCSLYELILDEAEETKKTFSLLLQEIKEKDFALPVPLNDGGFLLLLHPSHFLTYDDSGLNAPEVLQGLFVFPSSRVVQKDTKFGHRVASLTSDILRILPVLSYAQGEVEKTAFDPTEDLCEVLSHHMQSYAALINPGLTSSPSRELSIFPDQYDVPDAHKHLYSSPEWNNRAWQSFRSYMSKPVSFQLPVSKASEILAAGQEERREDLDDDVYICLSSPEGEPSNPVDMESEEQFTDETSLVNTETPLDSCVTSVEAQTDSKDAAPVVVPDNIKAGDETKVSEKSGTTELIKTDDADMKNSLTPPTPDDLSAELIVSITSAARNVTDESLSVISTVSATKNNDFQLSAFSAAKMQTVEANSLRDQTITIKKKDCSEVTNFSKTKRRKLRRGCSRGLRTESVSLVETFSSQEVKNLEKGDQAKASSGHSQLNNPLSTDWRKFRRRKRKFGSLSSRNKKVRPASVALDVAEGKNDPGPQSSEGTVSMELEVFPLRKKTERWDLKPVVSVCGRILVPHGSADDCDQVKSLKNQIQCTKQEPEKQDPVLVDTSVKTHESVIVEQESSVAAETAMDKTEVKTSKEGVNDPPVVESSCVNIEHSLLRQSDECLPSNIESSVHSSKNDGTETPPSETVKEQHADGFSQGKSVTKGEVLLSKLKSVLLRGKRKKHLRLSEGITIHTPQNTEPCPKKGKVDSADALRSNNAITIAQDTNVGVMDISNIPSVDPLFAYALGLTPKEKPDKVQKNEGQEPPKKDSTNTQAQIILHRPPQIMRRPPSICPRRGRIKTLKKHQGISAEHIKKNWWLHFQTPACFATEKYKECTSDNSVRKTVKEKMNSACSSTDALNLLADLALSASNDKVPPQPDPALERKPVTSLKKCGLTKDVTSAEQESVLHALLRQPAARSIQPLESPSPSHLVGDSEMIGLISKEHAYSLPPSSPLLLGLPGTPFQVPPLSGSTRLLHHHQQLHGDGKQTLHPSVCQENRRERNHRTPENQKKHMLHRPKFRRSRTFVNTDGSVKITRQWNENYDFTRDSKFASDAKGRAIIRALHGPWDVSIQDTAEEVRLIVHMWIGLFYSRSTARIFHIDTNFSYQFREEESLEMSSEKIPALVQSELCPSPSVTDTEDSSVSKALDLSKKDNSVVDPGSVVLDLSLRNSSAETVTSDPQVDGKETCVSDEQKGASDTLKASMSSFGLQETSTVQCHKTIVQPTKMIDEVKENRSFNKKEKDCQNDILSKSDGSSVPPLEEIESKPIWTENVQAALRIDYMLLKCNKEKTQVKHDTENSETTRTASTDSTKSVTDKVDEPKEADKVVHTDVHEKAEFKEVKKSEMKENPCQEGNQEPSPKEIHTSDYSTNKKLGIFCNGYTLEDENQLSKEKPQGVSPGKTEDGNEDVSCCTVHDGKKNTDEKHFGKDPELDGKDNCVPPVDVDKDLSNQPLPMICDSPDPEKDCSTDSSHQAPSGEKLSQADNKGDTRHYLLLTKLCPNGGPLSDKRVISEKARHTPRKNKRVKTEPTVQNNSENDICLANKPQNEKVELTTTDEGTRSVDKPSVDGCVPKSKDSLEAGSQNVAKVISSCGPSTDKPENQEIKSVVEEEKEDNTTQEEPIHHKSVSPQCEIKKCESEEALTKENPIKMEETYEMMEKSHSRVIIPFIGVDISGEDIVDPQTSHPKDQGEQAVEGPKGIPFIGETNCSDLATEICRTPEMSNKKEELSTLKIPLLDVSETEQLAVFGNESDDRCPTPTLDEKPYGCINFPGPSSSTSAFSSSETYKNFAQKCLSRGSTPTKDGMAVKQNLFHKSTINHDPDSHYGLHPDLELRTLRVLQSIDKFLSKSSCIDKSRTMGKPGMKNYLSQTPNHSNTYIPTSLTPGQSLIDLKDKKISISKSEVVSASTSQELHKESSDHFLIAPFKNKLEEVLGVRLQLKKMDSPLPQHHHERPDKLQDTSVGQDHFPSYSSASATECLQTRHKTAVQCNLTLEPRSYSQRPVMAVKPSKNDESHADYFCNDAQHEYFVKTKQIKTPEVASTAMPLEKNTESFKGQNDDELDSELSSKSGWWSNVNDSKINLDKAKLALLDASYRSQASEKMFSSSLYMQSFEEENSDRQQSFLTDRLHEKVGHTTEDSVEKDCSEASTSFVGCMPIKDEAIIDDDLKETPQSSLICTVYNTNQMKSLSFLEQVSQRCLQDDPTQVSIEQECLIFLEQIKQVLKRSDRGPVCQQETHDKSLPCTSPVTVNFSNLEEQEDSLDVLDTPSLVGQKIMVDMSDRKDFTEKENTSHRSSPGTGNLKEHAGISFATAECARLYEAMMDNVCAVRNIPSRSKHLRMDRGYKKTEPSNHFDFCDQMKREMDESFRSNLNSVVKKSCKTKYRFYILETSDDAIFKETKAQLEAEGHTAVQPTEFFLGEGSSSSLLIILRNEDIAEHICEVPHLLKLKKSPGVQFAGIDEPDDVVNLTHQELFTRGGFIMFDRAALEPLSLCNLKKCLEILEELSRDGKWKWMLHYRDHRRLKENARLSAEAKEKKHFLNFCQDNGILEVLPYHECDLMSRDQPDYLTCLIRLQVQNISARYPVFVTDTPTDSAFGRNGILTTTVNSFLTNPPSETFTA